MSTIPAVASFSRLAESARPISCKRRDAGVEIFDDPDKIKRGEMPLRFTRSTIAPWGSGCRLAGGIDAARAGQAVHWYAGIAQRDHRGRIGPSDMVVSNSPGVNSRSARHGRLGNRQTDEIAAKPNGKPYGQPLVGLCKHEIWRSLAESNRSLHRERVAS